MGSKQTVTIKDYHNGGGDLTIEVMGTILSERTVGQTKIIRLKLIRKPDKNSTRLGMFAYLRNHQPGYQNMGFAEVTLIFDRTTNDGKFLSRVITVFFDVGVESLIPKDDEEEITLIAARKSEEFAISNVVGRP